MTGTSRSFLYYKGSKSTSLQTLESLSFQAHFTKKLFAIQNTKLSVGTAHAVVVNKQKQKQKQVLLCLHGANAGPVFWIPFIKQVLQNCNHEIHCLSIPGFGMSFLNHYHDVKSLTLHELKSAILSFIKEYITTHLQTGEKPILVGHSFGGYLAACFASEYPELCKRVVLINAAGCFPIFGSSTVFWGSLFSLGFPNSFVRNLGILFHVLVSSICVLIDDPGLHWNLHQMICKTNFGHVVVSKFIDFTGFTSRWKEPVFGQLMSIVDKVPIQIIHGEDDWIIPKELALFMEPFINQPTHIIRNCGHSPSKDDHWKEIAIAITNTNILKKTCIITPKKIKRIEMILSKYYGVLSPVKTIQLRNQMFQEVTDEFTFA